ncbi:MAG: sulfur transferase domain-containing protein [Gammaproteobacteria bacterium]|jgi:uncharacterized protein (TIGR01244 family)
MPTNTRFHSVIAIFAINILVAGFAEAQHGELPNRAEPLEDLTTSGQPDLASLELLAESGYTTVIDLRRPEENRGIDERSIVEGLGMSYVSLPIDGASGISYENADILNRLLSEAAGPVLLHCGSGNRAGALLALSEKLNGADNETALAVGRKAGMTGLGPTVQEKLETDP